VPGPCLVAANGHVQTSHLSTNHNLPGPPPNPAALVAGGKTRSETSHILRRANRPGGGARSRWHLSHSPQTDATHLPLRAPRFVRSGRPTRTRLDVSFRTCLWRRQPVAGHARHDSRSAHCQSSVYVPGRRRARTSVLHGPLTCESIISGLGVLAARDAPAAVVLLGRVMVSACVLEEKTGPQQSSW
jgi:hypothetical protein